MKAVDLRWDEERKAVSFTAVEAGEEYVCRVGLDALQLYGARSGGGAAPSELISLFIYNEPNILRALEKKLSGRRGDREELIEIRREDLPQN